MPTFSSDAHTDNHHLNGNRAFRNAHAQAGPLERLFADPATISHIVLRLCGEPNKRLSSRAELRFGTHGSLSVDLAKAVFFDHENDKGGGIFDLLKHNLRCGTGEAIAWLENEGFLPHASSSSGATGKKPRIVATYDYLDEEGVLRLQVVRFEPKDFRPRRPDEDGSGWIWNTQGVPTLPYRLPDLQEAIAEQKTVFVLEGEKDVDAAWKLAIPATCNAGGAKKWRTEHAAYLQGADVVVIPDNDAAGHDHAHSVAISLSGIARRVRFLELPDLNNKGDFSDWLATGKTAEHFWNLVETAREYDTRQAEPGRLTSVSVASFAGQPIPPREWHTRDLVPAKNTTTLSGDGGTGKSLLAAQLSVATALGRPWLGHETIHGSVVYLGAEDDQDEMHRRFAAIARQQDVGLDRLGNIHILCLAGKNAVLASANVRDIVEPTPLWFELRRIVLEVRPKLVVYDTLADLFAGNENSRPQAQQFVSMLRGLALETDSTALLLAHPSLSGMSTGSGSSGSTAWSNSVRSRLYLDRVRESGVEPDPDARVLRTMKMNYGRAGGEVRLRWHDGVFILDAGPETSLAQATKIQQAETVFIDLLGAYNASGRFVTSTTGANYAPAAFAKEERGQSIGKRLLETAMNHLFEGKRIHLGEYGPPSKRRKRLEVAT
jgi:RecA-family ATPase